MRQTPPTPKLTKSATRFVGYCLDRPTGLLGASLRRRIPKLRGATGAIRIAQHRRGGAMRIWPFGESRADGNATDDAIGRLLGNAANGDDPDANAISAAAACTRFYTAAMALAEVSPASLAATLNPVALAAIGRMLASTGNYVADLEIDDAGQIALRPTGDFEVAGLSPDPAQWAYQLNYHVPSRTEPIRRRRPAAGVVHCRINELPTAPHLGRSPIAVAHLSGRYAARLERRLGDDANTRVMHIIPVPDATPAARLETLRANLKRSEGNIHLTESMSPGGWGQGRLAAPQRDWQSNRVGPEIPQSSIYGTQLLWPQITAAYGLHAGMWLADGTTAREAFRSGFVATLIPLSEQIAHVLSDALGTPVSFNFDRAMYADIRARGSAYKSFVDGGIDPGTALTIIGLGDVALPASPPATPPTPPPPGQGQGQG